MTLKQGLIPFLFLLAMAPTAAISAEYYRGDTFSDSLKSGGSGPKMVVVPEGKFVLGGGRKAADELGMVTIDSPLAFSTTEITRGQYRRFLEATQSADLKTFPKGGDDLPVTGLTWDETEAYATWLSREAGHHYRLPSSSEWEYAARAGASSHYSWGEELGKNNANCQTCETEFEGSVAPVGSFPANDWGLYDMHGNVWEWTKDCIDANSAPPSNGMPQLFGDCELRELRGGSARSDGWSIRAGARASAPRKTRLGDVGFRVVREIEP